MNHLILLLLLSFGVFTVNATSVHVCTDVDGKKSFQDMPCGDDLSEAVKIIETTPSQSSAIYDTNSASIAYKQMRSENDRRQLARDIRRSENRIVDYRNNMQRELSLLRKKKNYANNNLAGAEWENSISTEMQAVTSKYSTLITSEEARLANLRKQAAGN